MDIYYFTFTLVSPTVYNNKKGELVYYVFAERPQKFSFVIVILQKINKLSNIMVWFFNDTAENK